MICNPASMVTLSGIPQNFTIDSWDTIATVAELGVASNYYNIGDVKTIGLNGIGDMTLQIADFNHDYLSASTTSKTAGITLITKNLLYQVYKINNGTTNVGGFPDSQLYDVLSTTIYNALPADLRNVVKAIYKWYGTGNDTSNGQWFGSKIWIPLEYEVFGSSTYAPTQEQSTGNARKYPIFTDDASRIKKMNNGNSSTTWWWLGSPNRNSDFAFVDVRNNGMVGSNGSTGESGVAFGLCI